MDARGLGWNDALLVLTIIVVAVVSKVVGAGLGARWGGFSNRQALQLGAGMVSRGEVGLIVAAAMANEELYHRTLFTVAPDEATVDRIVAATEAVLGDLSLPNSGFLFVVPVSRAVGLRKQDWPKR